jgi:hypothetical protein
LATFVIEMAKNPQNQENSRAAHRLKRRALALRANLRRRKESAQQDAKVHESGESDPKDEAPKFTTPTFKS